MMKGKVKYIAWGFLALWSFHKVTFWYLKEICSNVTRVVECMLLHLKSSIIDPDVWLSKNLKVFKFDFFFVLFTRCTLAETLSCRLMLAKNILIMKLKCVMKMHFVSLIKFSCQPKCQIMWQILLNLSIKTLRKQFHQTSSLLWKTRLPKAYCR